VDVDAERERRAVMAKPPLDLHGVAPFGETAASRRCAAACGTPSMTRLPPARSARGRVLPVGARCRGFAGPPRCTLSLLDATNGACEASRLALTTPPCSPHDASESPTLCERGGSSQTTNETRPRGQQRAPAWAGALMCLGVRLCEPGYSAGSGEEVTMLPWTGGKVPPSGEP
jgi:hypothetical protein